MLSRPNNQARYKLDKAIQTCSRRERCLLLISQLGILQMKIIINSRYLQWQRPKKYRIKMIQAACRCLEELEHIEVLV